MTFVRETGQNSLDAALSAAGGVTIRYSLIELSLDSPAFAAFKDAINIDELLSHVSEAARTESRLGTRLAAGVKQLNESGKLLLLRVDDYGTTGLYGSETSTEEASPFAALVRNNLDSSKRTTTAGGSFGLGKAVLWRCSDLSTVLFASKNAKGFQPDHVGYRFIAKTELTWHETEGKQWAGPGWLGRSQSHGEALWVDDGFLERIQMGRDRLPEGVDSNRSSGTSVLVIGFRDPEAQGPVDPRVVADAIAREAARNFWPALQRGRLSVLVEAWVNDKLEKSIIVPASDDVRQCREILAKHDAEEIVEELTEPGDVVRISVPITIPATRAGAKGIQAAPEVTSNAQLLVRLAGPDDLSSTELNRIALIRGRGMVVRYWRRDNLVVGAQPFHAAVLVGEAAGNDSSQLAAEQFFRLAEPPAHDDWKWSDELREKYERGAKMKLEAVYESLSSALRKVITPPAKAEDDGPPELKRLLQLEAPASATSVPATLRNAAAFVQEDRWIVEADIHITDRSKLWAISPRLAIRTEDNSSIRVAWESVETTPLGVVDLSDEEFLPDATTKRFRFRGVSAVEANGIHVSRCRTQLDLAIREREA